MKPLIVYLVPFTTTKRSFYGVRVWYCTHPLRAGRPKEKPEEREGLVN